MTADDLENLIGRTEFAVRWRQAQPAREGREPRHPYWSAEMQAHLDWIDAQITDAPTIAERLELRRSREIILTEWQQNTGTGWQR